MRGRVCLTFDIEERFHSHLSAEHTPRVWSACDRISKLIDWLEASGRTATCFIVGELAERHPGLVKKMHTIGCEIASHTHTHMRICAARRADCKRDIERSKKRWRM